MLIYSQHVRLAVQALRAGGVIAYPTEGVWGLGCDPFDVNAVARLLDLKRRDPAKGLILVAADITQIEPFLAPLTDSQRAQLLKTWPGPQTWVIPHNGSIPEWISGGQPTVAVRVSAHPLVAALTRAFGRPLVSTSANPSTRPPARSALRVRCYFPQQLDYVLPGRLGGQRGPTPIRDLSTGNLRRGG